MLPDLDAYFDRISYDGPRQPSLEVLHSLMLAHVQAIPFENLDVLLERPIELGAVSLFQKLVQDRRGGYCFEQNGLFLHVLETLGFRVQPISARVRIQRPRDFTPPRTHMFLRVEVENENWLADVGVGGLSLTAPLKLHTTITQTTPHDTRRIILEGKRYFHQVLFGTEWNDVCEFTLEEMPMIDCVLANWYTSTHPASHFKDKLMVARAGPSGQRLTLLNNEFSVRGSDGKANTRTIDTPEQLLDILSSQFGLTFPAGTHFSLQKQGRP